MLHPLPADELLWQALREGSAEALAELARRYTRKLIQYGVKLVPDVALVEDCVQDVFVVLWTRHAFLGDTTSVKFYLYKALRTHLFREEKKIKRHTEFDPEALMEAGSEPDPEAQFIGHETAQDREAYLRDAIARLPKRQQEALFLRYYENLSHEQISALLDINPQSVANLLHRGLTRLRESWAILVTLLMLSLVRLGGFLFFL